MIGMITSDDRKALVLPEEALVPQGTDQFVFRIEASKAVRVKVETGQRRDGKVEILSGLKKDDLVVTAGQLKLRDGTLVRNASTNTGAGGNPAGIDPHKLVPATTRPGALARRTP